MEFRCFQQLCMGRCWLCASLCVRVSMWFDATVIFTVNDGTCACSWGKWNFSTCLTFHTILIFYSQLGTNNLRKSGGLYWTISVRDVRKCRERDRENWQFWICLICSTFLYPEFSLKFYPILANPFNRRIILNGFF